MSEEISNIEPAHKRMTLAEFVIAAIVLFAFVGGEIVATHAKSMFTQTPWLDEVHTLIIVNEPNPAAFRAAVSDECIDGNFPVYSQLLRWLHIQSAPAIRGLSCASMMLALLGVYVLLRGAFDPIASAAGVLTVWSGPLIAYHTFQARFYAPWLAAVIWFAVLLRMRSSTFRPRAHAGSSARNVKNDVWSLNEDAMSEDDAASPQNPARPRGLNVVTSIALAVMSIFACTLHTLGLPAISLIALAELICNRRSLKRAIIAALPAITGVIAVAAFVPVIQAQKRSFAIPTWITGNPIRLFYSTIGGIIPEMASAVVILGLFASAWIDRMRIRTPFSPRAHAGSAARNLGNDERRSKDTGAGDPSPQKDPAWAQGLNENARALSLAPVAGFSALLLFPLALLAMTLLLQPVLLSRYAIVSAAAFALPAALIVSKMRRSVAIVVCLAIAFESSAELTRRVREAAGFREESDATLAALRAEPDTPLLFESRHQLYPVTWLAPDLRDRSAYIDFQPGPNQLDPITEGAERDVAKKFEHLYGWPHVMAWEKMMGQKRFILVSMDENTERIKRRFEGFKVELREAEICSHSEMTLLPLYAPRDP